MRRLILALTMFAALAAAISAARFAQDAVGHISGTVEDATGRPQAAATVTLSSRGRVSRTTTTNAGGRFEFRDVPVGTYVVAASVDGLMRDLPVNVSTNVTSTVTVSLGGTHGEKMNVPPPVALPPPPAGAVANDVLAAPAAPPFQSQGMSAHRRRSTSEFNTESYARIDDNTWTRVVDKPLSTFSTDVDTAAYANVRRFINEGRLPPKDAVRIEELINYFSYDYPEPRAADPISITTALGDSPWNPRNRLLLIGLQARHLDLTALPPRNLVFLVDVSGSMMEPGKLPLVQASLAMLARNLTDRDRIALVAYAGAAGLVLPSTPGGDTSRIIEAIGRLSAGGSTNGAQGIRLAYAVARQHFIKGGSNRVVLATDGDFNVGVTSQGELTRLIEEERASGVTLSALGFGMGNLKDSTLEQLADRGNGNYSYIDSLAEASKVLVDEAAGTLVTAAKDVKLQIEFNPRVVSSYRLIGYENRLLADRDFNDDGKDAGDMGAGHSVTALYELVMASGETDHRSDVDPLKYQAPRQPAPGTGRDEALTVKIRYKAPDGDRSSLIAATVPARAASIPALRFASAVAEFGMLLRDGESREGASYADVLQRARDLTGNDRHGHRAEFVRLVDAARALAALHSTR